MTNPFQPKQNVDYRGHKRLQPPEGHATREEPIPANHIGDGHYATEITPEDTAEIGRMSVEPEAVDPYIMAENALGVIVNDKSISWYLKTYDPKALEQAQAAFEAIKAANND